MRWTFSQQRSFAQQCQTLWLRIFMYEKCFSPSGGAIVGPLWQFWMNAAPFMFILTYDLMSDTRTFLHHWIKFQKKLCPLNQELKWYDRVDLFIAPYSENYISTYTLYYPKMSPDTVEKLLHISVTTSSLHCFVTWLINYTHYLH